MRSAEIRERYLRFFEDRDHLRLPNTSLIPHDDPSLLFTVAGMVPLKPYLSGQADPPKPRLVSCQRCFRGSGLHDDITEVGDTTHNTFFEMLGNWSIGDYFKRDAIAWAWELLTKDFGLDPARLVPSIYPADEEARQIWTKTIGVADERIARIEDNWWQAGPTGPCGYDSEIYADMGSPCSCGRNDCTPQDECGGDRWIEIWNLVFMEFEQHEDGSRTALPKPCVDTGMGLERISAVLQGQRSIFDNDSLRPLIDGFINRSKADPEVPLQRRSLNVLADHLRAAAFLISDGVFPGNEGRGYVLRRVIRRAGLHGRRIGLEEGLTAGVAAMVALVKDVYPELGANEAHVVRTLQEEEASFAKTIEAGSQRLEVLLESSGTISGEDAFRLYDTYGLPVELTAELAAERGLVVDREGFDAAMTEQRDRSRSHAKKVGFATGVVVPDAAFVGYEALECEATIRRIGLSDEVDELTVGEEDHVVLDPTPFYAEKGGQIGDSGTLTWHEGRATVLDTTYPTGDVPVSLVRVDRGTLAVGERVMAHVDTFRRAQIARHHSATHLLHKSLREVLGDTVVQRGSFVGPDHTTFDFSFSRALTADEVREVEHRMNAGIRHNYTREVVEMPIDEARATGAVALFGEKYGEKVRVVDFGGWARELCGGTHVEHSGDIGAAIILGNSSIGQGIRRIDMVVGDAAENYWSATANALRTTARQLKAKPEEVPDRVAALQEQIKKLTREIEQAKKGSSGGMAISDANIVQMGNFKVGDLLLNGTADSDAVVDACDRLFAEKLDADGVAVVIGSDTIAVKCGASAVAAGYRAGDLVKVGAEAAGGRGGGRPDFARGGIKDPGKRLEALRAVLQGVGIER